MCSNFFSRGSNTMLMFSETWQRRPATSSVNEWNNSTIRGIRLYPLCTQGRTDIKICALRAGLFWVGDSIDTQSIRCRGRISLSLVWCMDFISSKTRKYRSTNCISLVSVSTGCLTNFRYQILWLFTDFFLFFLDSRSTFFSPFLLESILLKSEIFEIYLNFDTFSKISVLKKCSWFLSKFPDFLSEFPDFSDFSREKWIHWLFPDFPDLADTLFNMCIILGKFEVKILNTKRQIIQSSLQEDKY